MFGVEIPDQPRIDSTFAAGLLGNILAGWGISVGGNNNKKKKKEEEQMSARNTGGQQTIVIKQPIELITKQPTARRISDLDKL
jgi:Na+/glutamate symporter